MSTDKAAADFLPLSSMFFLPINGKRFVRPVESDNSLHFRICRGFVPAETAGWSDAGAGSTQLAEITPLPRESRHLVALAGGAYIISSSSPVLLVDDGGMITIVLTHALRALGFSELERKRRDPATGGSIKIRAGKRVAFSASRDLKTSL